MVSAWARLGLVPGTPRTNTPRIGTGEIWDSVRATDEIGLTTSSTNQGRLTVNAQVAGTRSPTAG